MSVFNKVWSQGQNETLPKESIQTVIWVFGWDLFWSIIEHPNPLRVSSAIKTDILIIAL